MKKILILANHEINIYNLRKELIERLVLEKYKVVISCPYGKKIEYFKDLGCEYREMQINRHGKNIIEELGTIKRYVQLIKNEKPDVILSFTIKPNVYGSVASRIYKVPIIVNITGLGKTLENSIFFSKLILILYRILFRKAVCIFCQNQANWMFLEKNKIFNKNGKLIPGSGVNLQAYALEKYPESDTIKFGFASRITKDKGIKEYLQIAEDMKEKYGKKVEFHICGFCEEDCEGLLEEYIKKGIVYYHGMITDMKEFYKEIHCLIHPSYYEGMANVILEAAATGRPAIVSNISGCKEAILHGDTGYCVRVKDVKELQRYTECFLQLPLEQKREMGKRARKKIEKEFDREIVVEEYLKAIKKV